MGTTLDLLEILGGFTLLVLGAGWLVDGGATLARRLGISPLVVGLTIVAWGTSMPEVVVSSLAAYRGLPASSLGNVIGSNTANIGLVLGSSAMILPSILLGRVKRREATWLIGSLVGLWLICGDAAVTRMEAVVLLASFAVYNLLLVRDERTVVTEEAAGQGMRRPGWAALAGSLAIAGGAELVMRGALGVAATVGMPDRIVGLTILALGTSLPELAAGVTSARRGHPEIGLGNVIGSNVFNTLAVTGIAGVIRPFQGAHASEGIRMALSSDFPVALGFSVVLVALPRFFRGSAGVGPGGALVLAYLAYITWLLIGI